jgi:ATP-dependent helicase/nuclease subunit B
MRAAVGLPSPEERVGQMAHDFLMTACAARTVVLSCPRRRDGAPAVPARWLARLEAMLAGAGIALPDHPAVAWARALDQPADGPSPVQPPEPRPLVIHRPRALSLTEIETWLRDPYAIHARHILRLKALDALDESPDAADYGSIVHAGLHGFLARHGHRWPADGAALLQAAMQQALDAAGMRPALVAWWRPRLARIAAWVAEEEARRRSLRAPQHIAAEVTGEWSFAAPAGPFRLRGRADRIERYADGTLALLDYKTGDPPKQKEVEQGLAPQLPLEAAMAAAGGFGADLAHPAAELTDWHQTGGIDPGKSTTLWRRDAARVQQEAATASDALRALVAAYDNPARAYLAAPNPGAAPRFSDYRQLSRLVEWAASVEAQ